MGLAFYLAAAAGLIFCIVFPSLLPFVLGGIVIGLLPKLGSFWRYLTKRSGRHRSIPAYAGAIAAVVGLAASIPLFLSAESELPITGGGGEEEVIRAVPLALVYRGEGTYEDDPERLEMVERLSVALSDLRAAAESFRRFWPDASVGGGVPRGPNPATFRGLQRILIAHLAARGWVLIPSTTTHDRFQAKRQVPLHSHSLPGDTGNEIPLPEVADDDALGRARIQLHFVKGSRLVLIAPTRTFDSTRPGSDREERLVADVEERKISLSGDEAVEVDVRASWLRSGVTSTVANGLVSGATNLIGLLYGILIAVLSEPVKDWLRKRLGFGGKAPQSPPG